MDHKKLEALSVLVLYRMLIKNMKFFPSKNKFLILESTKEVKFIYF